MHGSQIRNNISGVAEGDWRAAEKTVGTISDPWFMCQSFTKVSLYAPDPSDQKRLLDAAFAAAKRCPNPNRIITVGAWPVKAAIRLGHIELAKQEVQALSSVISSEPSPVRRANALNELLGACSALPTEQAETFWRVYGLFVSSCVEPLLSGKRNVRGHACLSWWAGHIHSRDPEKAEELVKVLVGPQHHARAQKLIRERLYAISWPNV